jgi:hypothetical protein
MAKRRRRQQRTPHRVMTMCKRAWRRAFQTKAFRCFAPTVKSDLAGLAEAGELKLWIEARDKEIGYKSSEVRRDLLGPVRQAGASEPGHDLRDAAAALNSHRFARAGGARARSSVVRGAKWSIPVTGLALLVGA